MQAFSGGSVKMGLVESLLDVHATSGGTPHTTHRPIPITLHPTTISIIPLHSVTPCITHATSLSTDLSAAKHADVLFVKVTGIDEKDNLKKHCDKAGIPYVPFSDFHVAKAIVGQIIRGEKTKEDFLVKGVDTTTE